jgi:multimeric flavodoxin WrbA
MYSHVYQLAEAIAEGARELDQTEVSLFQVPELMSDETSGQRYANLWLNGCYQNK